jgi:hypothetical protein
MNQSDSNAKNKFWRRLKHELTSSFSKFLSSMAEAFLFPATGLPDSILEIAEAQTKKSQSVFRLPVTPAQFRYSAVRSQLCFCSNYIEITLCAIPAKTPIGMLKLLDILRNNIRKQSIKNTLL